MLDKELYHSNIETMYRKLVDGLVLLSANENDTGPTGMTIAWGFFGNMWNEPFFIAASRPHRFTLRAIQDSQAFSVNFFDCGYKEALNYFGRVSGYEEKKFEKGYLHCSNPTEEFAPIDEAVIVLNCKLVTNNQIEPFNLMRSYTEKHYKSDNGFHAMLYGRVDEMQLRDNFGLNNG